jgi:hypothetical protein
MNNTVVLVQKNFLLAKGWILFIIQGGIYLFHKNMKLRHEYKYLLEYGNYVQIKNIIEKIMKLDDNTQNQEGYHVRSLYFDDMYDSALKEKYSGIQVRKKHRIRIYNYSQEVIKLEIKEKYGNFTNKISCGISKEEYEKIIAKDISFLTMDNNKVKEKYYLEIKNNLLKPKVIVDYWREAYTLPYNDIRITFDKNLAAAKPSEDIFTNNLFSKQVGQEFALIMEIKYNNFLPSHIKSVLKNFSLNKLSVSKYLLCREELSKWGND